MSPLRFDELVTACALTFLLLVLCGALAAQASP